MKHLKSRPFIFVAALIALGITAKINSYEVKADAAIKDQPSVVVRSANLSSNKIIKVPEKPKQEAEIQPNAANSSKSKKTSAKTKTPNRGGSGLSKAPAGSRKIISHAYKYLGRPYIWGASGPGAFDCSGFTSYVYRVFGVSLPHNAASQFGHGQAVRKGNLSSGDLVFFNTSGGISHVGLYIGNGRFIHAANSRTGVIVSSLSEGYYLKRFVGARRILN